MVDNTSLGVKTRGNELKTSKVNEEMMDPEKIMDGISKELQAH